MPYQPYLAPAVALIAGILILIQPGLLSIIVAVYLIVTGLLGLMGRGPRDGGADNLSPPKGEIKLSPKENTMKGKFNFKLGALCAI